MSLGLKTLGQDVDATAVAAQTAVTLGTAPFVTKGNSFYVVSLAGVTGTPTIKIQGSDDGSTWTDLKSITDITQYLYIGEITNYASVRLNVTAGGSAGTVTAYLFGDA